MTRHPVRATRRFAAACGRMLGRVSCAVVLGWLMSSAAAAQVPRHLTESDARHLLTRTGFSPSPREVAPWVGMTPAAAVDRLLSDAKGAVPVHPPPEFTTLPISPPYRDLPDDDARKLARQRARDDTRALATWWLQEMRDSPTPLAERMTLFWHNHFATSEQKVQQPQGMYVQHRLFRRWALGSFRDLLQAVARDPAMLIYLDGASNRARSPNENFAREAMELFTLGEGQYGETDVREAARAFSGWTVQRATWEAEFRPKQFDGGDKTLFGRTAPHDMTSALDTLLDRPAAAPFIVTCLWREFVSPTPDERTVARVAARLRSSGWQVDVALRELLLSDAFWSADARGSLVKSPVDLAIGTLRQFDIALDSAAPLETATVRWGQSLFYPPNVKGWPGQTAWIDSTSLLERKRFTERLFRALENGNGNMADAGAMDVGSVRTGRLPVGGGATVGVRFDARAWLQPFGAHPDREPDAAAAARLRAAVLAVPAVDEVPAGTVGLSWLRAMTLDPAFQLK